MRRSVVWRWVLSAGLVATCLSTIGAAGARQSNERTAASAAAADRTTSERALAAAKNKFGIPEFPYTDAGIPAAYDGTGIATAQASKLRTKITLPNALFLSYLSLCVQVIQLGSDNPAACPDFHPPTTTFDSFDNAAFPVWIQATGPIWIKSPAGARLGYGSFPTVRVSTLAFGSVPVTASLHISQPVGSDGFVTPLNVRYLTTASPLPNEGGSIYKNRYWPGTTFPANNGTLYDNHFFEVTGKVDIRLSDVALDGRALDVGPSCRTSAPGSLTLGSPTGAYDKQKLASDLRGRPGGAQVLSDTNAGSAQGSLSIPQFSGCGVGREDLDPLLTSFVSGPRNPLDIAFTRGFTECSNSSRTQPCPDFPKESAPPTAPAGARTAAAAPTQTSATWSRLTAGQRQRVAAELAALPRPQRSLVLSALPLPIAAAVRAAR